MVRFLVSSIVLTIVLNVGLRAFPGFHRGLSRWLQSLAGGGPNRADGQPGQADRAGSPTVIFPWKAMIIGSVLLTVVVNLFLR